MFNRFQIAGLLIVTLISSARGGDDLALQLRYQKETSPGSGRYHRLHRAARWKAAETAVIVCDVWDLHHSLNAVRRVEEVAPRLNKLLVAARGRGMTIIHSPSDCMDAYRDHPARRRAIEVPKAAHLPDDIQSWCSRIPKEEKAVYPLDQSDGGDDDDPAEHAKWAAKLKAMGRNPGIPWKSQSALIEIDGKRDYISDRGHEVWNILASGGIKNVILTGVHTNMCVLGRPFGLRQMARNGINVVLARDMTDTMYNPARWPYVSHFTGTDLIVSHIERFVCATMTSDQLLGGKPFRFKNDRRPHAVVIMAEDEYETNRSLPRFSVNSLGKYFRVSLVFGNDKARNDIPGLDVVSEADVVLFSVRRRTLPPRQMELVRRFVAAGKPVLGIRTASHAFSLRGKPSPAGTTAWPEFDAQVFGGNYTNHYGNKLKSTVSVSAKGSRHPILAGISVKSFPQSGSLYKTAPLVKSADVVLTGSVTGHAAEPVAWTFQRPDGGRSFYTSLGHPGDFENENFVRLLVNAFHWAVGRSSPKGSAIATQGNDYRSRWTLVPVPASWEQATHGTVKNYDGPAWYRCAVRVRKRWQFARRVTFSFPDVDAGSLKVWFNGQRLAAETSEQLGVRFVVPTKIIEINDANLLVVRIKSGSGDRGWARAPLIHAGTRKSELAGRWQFRLGDSQEWSNIPLPARYGASTDILFEPTR